MIHLLMNKMTIIWNMIKKSIKKIHNRIQMNNKAWKMKTKINIYNKMKMNLFPLKQEIMMAQSNKEIIEIYEK